MGLIDLLHIDSRSVSLDDSVSQSRSLSLESLPSQSIESPLSVQSVMEPRLSGQFECAADLSLELFRIKHANPFNNLKAIGDEKLFRGLGNSVSTEAEAQKLVGTQRLIHEGEALPSLENWLTRHSDRDSAKGKEEEKEWVM